jgi:hypothetical protein
MLHLPLLSPADEKAYHDMLAPRIKQALAASTLSSAAKAFLDAARIKKILCDQPKDLLRHHNAILPRLAAGLTPAVYKAYLIGRAKKEADRSVAEITAILTYKPVIDELKSVFNYDEFIMRHKITSYKLATMLDRNTCTYCNRIYTTTVIHKDPVTHRVNNRTRITRPNYDHWYSHGKYPVLGTSLYNLIPSCTVCNSSVKGAVEFSLQKHLHPYTNKIKQEFSFNYKAKNVHDNNVLIEVVAGSRSANTLAAFKIAEVYDEHSSYELKDLLELRYKYSEDYLDTLFNKTFDLKVGKKEVYRMIFGAEYEDVDHHKRPFSKFKKDILEKLGVKI